MVILSKVAEKFASGEIPQSYYMRHSEMTLLNKGNANDDANLAEFLQENKEILSHVLEALSKDEQERHPLVMELNKRLKMRAISNISAWRKLFESIVKICMEMR